MTYEGLSSDVAKFEPWRIFLESMLLATMLQIEQLFPGGIITDTFLTSFGMSRFFFFFYDEHILPEESEKLNA